MLKCLTRWLRFMLREPQGVTATLSPGTFGHVGYFGTVFASKRDYRS